MYDGTQLNNIQHSNIRHDYSPVKDTMNNDFQRKDTQHNNYTIMPSVIMKCRFLKRRYAKCRGAILQRKQMK